MYTLTKESKKYNNRRLSQLVQQNFAKNEKEKEKAKYSTEVIFTSHLYNIPYLYCLTSNVIP